MRNLILYYATALFALNLNTGKDCLAQGQSESPNIILFFSDEDTISQWVHRLFPRWMDVTIVVLLLIYTWYVFGFEGFTPILMGVIMGHLFWQE